MRPRLIVAAIAMSGLLAACGPAAHTEAACNGAFAKAADHVKQAVNADKIDWFPDLIRACGTTKQWTSAAAQYPSALLGADNAMQDLEVACASTDPNLSDEPLCREVAAKGASTGS